MSDFWKQAGKIVGTVAPTLATALGGPLAGMAVKAIGSALGLPDQSTEEQIAAAVTNATPADLLALKKADQEFQIRMRELDVDLEKVRESGIDSARRREVDAHDSLTPRILAAIVCIQAGAVTVAVLGGFVDGLKDSLTAAIVGGLITQAFTALFQVLNYYFGTSASSRAKDQTIQTLTK